MYIVYAPMLDAALSLGEKESFNITGPSISYIICGDGGAGVCMWNSVINEKVNTQIIGVPVHIAKICYHFLCPDLPTTMRQYTGKAGGNVSRISLIKNGFTQICRKLIGKFEDSVRQLMHAISFFINLASVQQF